MIRISEQTSLIACTGFGITLVISFGTTDTKRTRHLITDGFGLLTLLFSNTLGLGFFLLTDTFFFLSFFPFLLFFLFLALLLFLLLIIQRNTFFQILRQQIFLGRFHLWCRSWRSRCLLRKLLSGILRFESSGRRINVSEVNQNASIFLRNDRLQDSKPENQKNDRMESQRSDCSIYVIFIKHI